MDDINDEKWKVLSQTVGLFPSKLMTDDGSGRSLKPNLTA